MNFSVCVRYLDKDGVVGCSNESGGNVGEVYLVENQTETNIFK